MRLYKKLHRKLEYFEEDQIEEIRQAYQLARSAHQGQKRYTGEAYITHPVAVAGILADMRLDKETIISALLHDVIEDTSVEKSVITEQFGEQVANLVDGVSKLTQIEFKTHAEAQAENFRKMLLAMSRDIRVIIVKLADRLHNMRTLGPLRPDKRRRIALETLQIFSPIAHRLGMHEIAVELEELGFESRYPMRYHTIKSELRKVRRKRREIIHAVAKALKQSLHNNGIDSFEIKSREKHLFSIYRKMRDKHLSFSGITDLFAFRVILDSVDECYRVLGIVHRLYKPLLDRFKDYIAIPKTNGYQSLHTTLFGPYGMPVEIQIRTVEMDEKANCGIAAHWIYKTGDNDATQTQLNAEQWLSGLLELQQNTGNSLEFIENVKVDLFPDEVYVFTPKGVIKQLPGGATAIDFAYAVHTDLGNSCVAVKVDRQLSPLSTQLASGQTVEIITAKGARPSPSWLDYVVTGKARSNIRHFLKSRRRSESIVLGHQLLNHSLKSIGLTLKKMPDSIWDALLKEMRLSELDDLYEDIGLGNRPPILVAKRTAQLYGEQSDVLAQAKETESPLIIKGTEGMLVNFASCCYPIPGDPILGILDAGHGILVHMASCKRITKLRADVDRCVDVRWTEHGEGEFKVTIVAEVVNRRGVLAAMAVAIADAGANIDDINLSSRVEQHYSVELRLIVQNRTHLASVLRHLRKLSAVNRVERIKS